MERAKIIERLDSAEVRRILGDYAKVLLELLEARCRDCANAKCFYDREPVCSHFEQRDVEL